jgi:site-specific DNA-methyltransferase (cytosine-N4-specific)
VTDLILIKSDARHIPLKDESVQCVVTSPPYWGLRDYGTARWEGGDEGCDHLQPPGGGTKSSGLSDYPNGLNQETIDAKVERIRQQYKGECPKCGARRIDSQLGLESTLEAYVANMVEVFREVRRVLKPDGCLFLNLGDSYYGGKGASNYNFQNARTSDSLHSGHHNIEAKIGGMRSLDAPQTGLKPKDLVGIPWRVAFALQTDGWWLRQDIIWHKPNPMPESVTDRCTKAHEYMFLLTKSARYYWDKEAMKEACVRGDAGSTYTNGKTGVNGLGRVSLLPRKHRKPAGWDTSTGDGGHNSFHKDGRAQDMEYTETTETNRNRRSVWTISTQPYPGAHFATFPETLVEPCILAGSRPGDVVFDPFGGSGTVARVAIKHNRNAVHCDLAYHELARDTRCAKIQRRMFT